MSIRIEEKRSNERKIKDMSSRSEIKEKRCSESKAELSDRRVRPTPSYVPVCSAMRLAKFHEVPRLILHVQTR